MQVGALRFIPWSEIVVDTSLGTKSVIGKGSYGVVLSAVWKGRRVAVKVMLPSEDLEPEEAYHEACVAAETEANMITMAEQGIDSQELMVKLYGISHGPLPAH